MFTCLSPWCHPHENIRSASFSDISDIIRIMRPAIADEILVPRTPDDIAEKIDDFVIYEVDGTPHACGALHMYNNEQAEIAGVAVDNTYSSLGIGKKIINFLLDKAIKNNLKQVFVLTTQTSDWFLGLGFTKNDVSALPQEKQQQYNKQRNSLIFTYTIDSVRKKRHYSVE